MLELLMIIVFAGLILSSRSKMGMGNPFQIYFMIWFLVIFGYYISSHTYKEVSSEFIRVIIAAKLFSFLLLLIAYRQRQEALKLLQSLNISKHQDRLILLAQIAVTVALLFVYLRALDLAAGECLFTVYGYRTLRKALTIGGESYGLLSYFFILSFVVSSLTVFSYRQGSAHLGRLILSGLVSLSYVYLSTGRTFVLLFLCLTIAPLVISGAIRLKGMLASVVIFTGLFMVITVISGKGISSDTGFWANIDSFLVNIRMYTIAPFVALSDLLATDPVLEWGKNTFRFFISFQYALGLSDIPPVPLIRDYVFVPDATNVYTVYDVYFRDFSYFGILIPPAFLVIHYWLYCKAIRLGQTWLFYYSASLYPLVMQFFQDQYFSLLSIWIQITVWYWLFLMLGKPKLSTITLRHD